MLERLLRHRGEERSHPFRILHALPGETPLWSVRAYTLASLWGTPLPGLSRVLPLDSLQKERIVPTQTIEPGMELFFRSGWHDLSRCATVLNEIP